MLSPPPPPVPQCLRELLREFPECIDRLQESLNTYAEDPSSASGPVRFRFERAMHALQCTLAVLAKETSEELDAARAAGDQRMIDRAVRKNNPLSIAGWFVFEKLNMEDIWHYLEARESAIK
ncbi:hypothetical protein ACOTEG_14440 [Achromobacter xylosoxidans]|uniref:hypothetical protein n=1 Tax=Alcaligenes xylosoxydans xylosoxydans TaxID=85698 RepID=UPI0010415C13|nr:hypothetical protein [Achromobacter xylosoxidans]MCH1992719.1 hypothetical protein [Achromobacter xylosoxidans]